MRYLEQTFTAPVSSGKMTQTDYEIRVGLRNPDGSLKQPSVKVVVPVRIVSKTHPPVEGKLTVKRVK